MEFKYRAVDKKPTTTTTTTSFPHSTRWFPQSTATYSTANYVSESSLPGASCFPCFPTNTFRMPAIGNVLWRELEKEKIRREIITGEIARRRGLEEEVRRELDLERSLGRIQMQRYLGAPHLFHQRVNPTAVDDMKNIIGVSQPPQLREEIESPLEIKPPSLQSYKDRAKAIVLAKPKLDNDLHAKRKAVTPPVCDTEPSASGFGKKAKEEWKCALCQINATSEMSFKKHLVGKKHKAKEASSVAPPREASSVAPPVCDTEPSASSFGKKAEEEWKCALCQISATSEMSFKKHLVGKKHKAKEASLTTQMIGLDAKPNRQTLQ